jgi:hypothetical protein
LLHFPVSYIWSSHFKFFAEDVLIVLDSLVWDYAPSTMIDQMFVLLIFQSSDMLEPWYKKSI